MILSQNRILLQILTHVCIFCVAVASNEENVQKFEKYSTCMRKCGISTWKIVDSNSNATSYNVLNYQWNKAFAVVFPIAIFIPSSVHDVQATVVCGYDAQIQLTPISGGHSYAGLSIGTNNSIVVDFRYMNSIDINQKEESVTVGPGAFIGAMHVKLWRHGGWGTTLGACMTVAIGGHALGGGYGFFAGLYGLVIDNLLEINMVDAQGNAVIVNPNQNSDLWWALRGVGPGYIGLVTSFKLKMFKAKDVKVTYVRIPYKVKDFQYVAEDFVKWLDWVKQNNQTVTSVMTGVHDNRTKVRSEFMSNGVDINLFHIEDPRIQPSSSEAMLAAYSKIFNNSTKAKVRRMCYIHNVISTSYSPVTLPQPQLDSKMFKNESLFIALQKQLVFLSSLTRDMAISRYSIDETFFVNKTILARDLNDVQKVFDKIPKSCEVWLTSEQGAIAVPRSTDSAYVHRDVIFDLRYHCDAYNLNDFEERKKWIHEFRNASQFMDSGQTYQNAPIKNLKNFLQRYYGRNLERLIQIKTKWDPENYFKSKQSIPIRNKAKFD